jgi:hypothetical protein
VLHGPIPIILLLHEVYFDAAAARVVRPRLIPIELGSDRLLVSVVRVVGSFECGGVEAQIFVTHFNALSSILTYFICSQCTISLMQPGMINRRQAIVILAAHSTH